MRPRSITPVSPLLPRSKSLTSAGLDMLYEWITSAFLDRRYTGRFRGLRGPGRPRTNWRSTVNKNLLRMGITWEETNLAANITDQNGVGVWPNCIHLHAGWIKVKLRSTVYIPFFLQILSQLTDEICTEIRRNVSTTRCTIIQCTLITNRHHMQSFTRKLCHGRENRAMPL